MPIYPYVCTECGHEFDALQKISDDPLTECPACGKPGLRKRLTAPAFKLKGTGWYETDFKNSGKQAKSAAKEGDGKGAAAGAGKDDGGGEKKESGKSGSEAKSAASGDGSKSSASAAKDD